VNPPGGKHRASLTLHLASLTLHLAFLTLHLTVNYEGTPLTTHFVNGDSFRSHQGAGRFRNMTYTLTTVVLQNLFAYPGETEGDRDVDITDFNVMATNFDPSGNNSATNDWTTADFDEDGDVDITDFNSLATNFAPGGYGGTSAVPEPSSLVLLLLGFVSVMRVFICCKRPLV